MPYADRDAQREFQRKWQAANRTPEQASATRRRATSDRQGRINALKAVPCADCGGRFHHVAMDFDHEPGTKSFGISEMVRGGWKWERIEAEVAKCEVVCANCHRVRTFERQRAVAQG